MDSLFFWLSKLTWLVIAPDSLLLILILAAWALLWRGAYRPATGLLGLVAVIPTVIALLPVGAWLLSPLEQRFAANPPLPKKIDGIIVLGGAEDARLSASSLQAELNDAAERHLALLALAKRYPEAKLVYTGGTGSMLEQQYKGAAVAELLYAGQGLDLSRLTFERNSRNTYENALLTLREIKPVPGESWVLITTAWHMPRSIGVFCEAGWPTIPYPVDHWTVPAEPFAISLDLAAHLRVLKHAAREWIGLIAYYATGKTTALLPDRCDEASPAALSVEFIASLLPPAERQ